MANGYMAISVMASSGGGRLHQDKLITYAKNSSRVVSACTKSSFSLSTAFETITGRLRWFSLFAERFVMRASCTSSRESSYYRQFLKCSEVVCEMSVLLESAISSIERWVKSVGNWSRNQNFPTVLTSAWFCS